MEHTNLSDEHINSFIDNQLDSNEKISVLNVISQDEKLREKICEIYAHKEMLKHAYENVIENVNTDYKVKRQGVNSIRAMAAALILFFGGTSGWLVHNWKDLPIGNGTTPELAGIQHIEGNSETRKVIVQIANSDPMHLNAVLDETEGLLDGYKRINRPIQVEVIANNRGLDLLRTDVTTYSKRIASMQEKYPNLNFLVCGQTLAKLRNSGTNVQLLPHTLIAKSATDQIHKRIQQGWGYVRI